MARAARSERFEITGELGSGGLGVVYEAFDYETQTPVAVKTLKDPSPEQLYWLKNEFRRLSGVRHRNLVEVRELHEEDGVSFIVMELIRGVDFRAYVRGEAADSQRDITSTMSTGGHGQKSRRDRTTGGGSGSGSGSQSGSTGSGSGRGARAQDRFLGGYDEGRLRRALSQLAEGLQALHAAGIVHRDVKPGNVLVEDGGRVVLLDFGLVELAGTAAQAGMRGTAGFMAPEQGLSEATPALDWYALGVMLFESLTGRLPFEGTSQEMLTSKRTMDAPSPSSLGVDAPPDLEQLCMALLSRDPTKRPTGEEVLEALSADPQARRGKRLAQIFVGREAELEALHAGLSDLRAGRFSALLIDGEPGVGKTELVRHFLAEEVLGRPGLLVLQGRCYEQEFIPFKGLDSIVDALASHLQGLDETTVAELLPERFAAVATLFPALYRVPAISRALPPLAVTEIKPDQRSQGFKELGELLAALSKRVQLVLFVDDLQWAGSDSEALLESLFGQVSPPAVLLLATRRTTDAWTAPSATPGTSDQESRSSSGLERLFRRLLVRQLTKGEASKLFQTLVASSGAKVSASDFEAVSGDAGIGHPLFLRELARHAAKGEELHRGLKLDHVLRDRIAALPTESRLVVEVCAVAGAPLPSAVLSRVAGLHVRDTMRALRQLRDEQLVRGGTTTGSGQSVTYYHDRVRESVTQGLTFGHYHLVHEAKTGPRLHLLLARELAAYAKENPGSVSALAIASHYNQAEQALRRDDDRIEAAEANAEAAKQSIFATAFDATETHLAAAGEHLRRVDPARTRELLRKLDFVEMDLAHHLVDDPRRDRAHERLQTTSADENEAATATTRLIMLLAQRGHFEAAYEVARRALGALGVEIPACHAGWRAVPGLLLASIRVELALWRGRERWLDTRVRRPLSRELAIGRVFASTVMTAYLLAPQSQVLFLVATMNGVLFELGAGTPYAAYAWSAYGLLCAAMGRLGRARRAADAVERISALEPAHDFSSRALVVLGDMILPTVAPFARAEAVLVESAKMAQVAGDTQFAGYATALRATQAMVRGLGLDAVSAYLARGIEVFARASDEMVTGARAWSLAIDRMRGAPGTRRGDAVARGVSEAFAATCDLMEQYWFSPPWEDPPESRRRRLARAREKAALALGSSIATILVFLIALESYKLACDHPRWLGRVGVLLRAGRELARFGGLARSCPENFGPHHAVLLGERARALGRPRAALAHLDRAIRLSREAKNLMVAAVAWERRTDVLRSLRDTAGARASLASAIAAYEAWGAHAKARGLREEFGHVE